MVCGPDEHLTGYTRLGTAASQCDMPYIYGSPYACDNDRWVAITELETESESETESNYSRSRNNTGDEFHEALGDCWADWASPTDLPDPEVGCSLEPSDDEDLYSTPGTIPKSSVVSSSILNSNILCSEDQPLSRDEFELLAHQDKIVYLQAQPASTKPSSNSNISSDSKIVGKDKENKANVDSLISVGVISSSPACSHIDIAPVLCATANLQFLTPTSCAKSKIATTLLTCSGNAVADGSLHQSPAQKGAKGALSENKTLRVHKSQVHKIVKESAKNLMHKNSTPGKENSVPAARSHSLGSSPRRGSAQKRAALALSAQKASDDKSKGKSTKRKEKASKYKYECKTETQKEIETTGKVATSKSQAALRRSKSCAPPDRHHDQDQLTTHGPKKNKKKNKKLKKTKSMSETIRTETSITTEAEAKTTAKAKPRKSDLLASASPKQRVGHRVGRKMGRDILGAMAKVKERPIMKQKLDLWNTRVRMKLPQTRKPKNRRLFRSSTCPGGSSKTPKTRRRRLVCGGHSHKYDNDDDDDDEHD